MALPSRYTVTSVSNRITCGFSQSSSNLNTVAHSLKSLGPVLPIVSLQQCQTQILTQYQQKRFRYGFSKPYESSVEERHAHFRERHENRYKERVEKGMTEPQVGHMGHERVNQEEWENDPRFWKHKHIPNQAAPGGQTIRDYRMGVYAHEWRQDKSGKFTIKGTFFVSPRKDPVTFVCNCIMVGVTIWGSCKLSKGESYFERRKTVIRERIRREFDLPTGWDDEIEEDDEFFTRDEVPIIQDMIKDEIVKNSGNKFTNASNLSTEDILDSNFDYDDLSKSVDSNMNKKRRLANGQIATSFSISEWDNVNQKVIANPLERGIILKEQTSSSTNTNGIGTSSTSSSTVTSPSEVTSTLTVADLEAEFSDNADHTKNLKTNRVQWIDMVGYPDVLGNKNTFQCEADPETGFEVETNFFPKTDEWKQKKRDEKAAHKSGYIEEIEKNRLILEKMRQEEAELQVLRTID